MKKIIALMFLIVTPFLFSSYDPSPNETATTPQYERDYNAGVKAQENSNYDDAIAYYQKAIDEKSDYTDAWSNMGHCYRMKAKEELAKCGKAYAKAVKYNPQHVGALEYQGEYFVMVGQLMSAYRNYQTLQKLNTDEAAKVKDQLDTLLNEAKTVLKIYTP
jgi:tetratricopeptide (TPR) repeat protein